MTMPYGCGHFWDNYAIKRNGDEERNRRMKPIRLVVVKSTTRPGQLSLRAKEGDATATDWLRTLTASGAKPGDVVELRLADKPVGHLPICQCGECRP